MLFFDVQFLNQLLQFLENLFLSGFATAFGSFGKVVMFGDKLVLHLVPLFYRIDFASLE